MKEAIGTSMVFNLIMVFTGVFIAILVGSIAYSKSFKIRNRIINIVYHQTIFIVYITIEKMSIVCLLFFKKYL